ncbi:hypothetical protein, partial [Bilophila wadsworthia]|uniref:hypothetical protein n=1 Tax=Bilophila wadsworthia TaxID=35833 RepID=UPI003AB2FC1B
LDKNFFIFLLPQKLPHLEWPTLGLFFLSELTVFIQIKAATVFFYNVFFPINLILYRSSYKNPPISTL